MPRWRVSPPEGGHDIVGPDPHMQSIVVHYQEIALKGKNRPWFLSRLVRNLRRAVADLDVTAVRALMGRIEMVLGPSASREEVGERIRRTFGVANYSFAGRTTLDLDTVASTILDSLGDRNPASFRVSVRRADKRFPMTSPQVEREIGGRIKAARGWTVNLSAPDLVIHVELLSDEAFYFFGKERGPGGLPTGTAGRVACLLSGGIDSPVAAHRRKRRGSWFGFSRPGSSVRACTSLPSASSSSRWCSPFPVRCAWSSIGG